MHGRGMHRTSLDEALAQLQGFSPEYSRELSDHAPMVLEALDRLDRSDLIEPYLRETLPHRRAARDERAPALDGYEALARGLHEELTQKGATVALGGWVARLAPGLSGAAFHGALRVAHAVRGLERKDTPARRVELCRAVAYGLVRSATLPTLAVKDTPARQRHTLAEALAEIEPSPEALAPRAGLISTALAERAARHPTLAQRAAGIELSEDSEAAADELLTCALALFTRSEHLPSATFTLLHAVTGMEAVGTLVRAVPEQGATLVLHAAHALLAMRVAFVGRVNDVDAAPPPRESFAALSQRALESLDDHACKLAAALTASPTLDDATRATALQRWL
jgi:hypothetical protein